MNAPNPLAALLGALPVTVNLTINGGVHIGDYHEGETIVEQVEEARTTGPVIGDLMVSDIVINRDAKPEDIVSLVERTINDLMRPGPRPLHDQEKRRPTVGRIVHYLPTDAERVHHGSKGNAPWAAIITGVLEVGGFEYGIDIVSLMVFPPNQKPFLPVNNIPEGGPKEKGAWSWPPKA